MNLILKFKVFGFVTVLILGGAVHLLSGLLSSKKNKFDVSDDLVMTQSRDSDSD